MICKALKAAISDELSAVQEYGKLTEQLGDKDMERQALIVQSIIEDESGHARIFDTLRSFLCPDE